MVHIPCLSSHEAVDKGHDPMSTNTISSKRLNLIPCVREALVAMGISSVQVVNAINGILEEAKRTKHVAKLGAGRVTKKAYSVTESESSTWQLPKCIVTTFDAWHSKLEAADKVAPMTEAVPIPVVFHDWLNKFKVEQPKEEQPA